MFFTEHIEHIRFKGFYFHHTLSDRPQREDFQRHCHNMYEIIYIMQGNGTFSVEGSKYEISPGSLLVFRPREFHCMNVSENSPYERLVVHFDEDIVYENAALLLDIFNNRELGVNNLYTDVATPALAAFESIATSIKMNEPERSIMAKLLLNELLVLLHNSFALGGFGATGESLITRIVNYINDNIATSMRLEDMAEKFFISKYHLEHIFKKYTGMPVMEYVIRKRVVYAQQLIAEGCPASAASSMCGFNDYSAFYRAYVKHIGAKPSDDTK